MSEVKHAQDEKAKAKQTENTLRQELSKKDNRIHNLEAEIRRSKTAYSQQLGQLMSNIDKAHVDGDASIQKIKELELKIAQ